MAKKIRLDFSKVEERSGWNTRVMPEGVHKFKIAGYEETEAQDGTDMLVFALVPADKKYQTRRFPFYCKLQANQLWKLRDLLVAAGQTVPKKAVNIDPSVVVGKFIAAEVADATGQYEGRSEIQGTYGLDILEDGGGLDEFAGDDEDEEYEGDEDADSEDEGDDEEGLETMTLPELKKLAKELGITGYTKMDQDALIEAIEEAESEQEDEDDDLDDEELEDEELDEEEEFEDDEEDEEPAPKRRAPAAKAAPAKKAPVRKAAAPAAKAAPTRRVVRR